MRGFRRRGELNLTLETAYTKFWIFIGRPCELFRFEMQSMTVRTLKIHRTQRMPMWRFTIWATTFWNIPQGLIVIHDLLDVFQLDLVIHVLLLSNIHLMLLSFHLPLLFLLLLQCRQISLVLLSFHLLLLLLLLLQFS